MQPMFLTIAASRETVLTGKSWRKELAYEAELFLIAPDGQVQKAIISASLLEEWAYSFQRMKALNVVVPVPLGHSSDPRARVGEIVDIQLRLNSNKKKAAFSVINFDDTVTVQEIEAFTKSDVSVFVEDWLDPELGKETSAITHVAITSRPQIPGLDKFVMALSLDGTSDPFIKGVTVAISAQLQQLAKKFNIDISAAADDAAATTILESKLGPALAPSAGPGDKAAAEIAGTGTGPVKLDPGHSSSQGSVSAAHEMKYNALVKSTAATILASRQSVLDSLVTGKYSTPDAIKPLSTRYLNLEKISAALSHDTIEDQTGAFDDAVAAIRESGQKFGGELSLAQVVGGNMVAGGQGKLTLAANAKARAEKARANRK